MCGRRALTRTLAAAAVAAGALSPSAGAPPAGPFKARVDMKTFMEHVLTPAATVIWRANGLIIDAQGEHDLSPKTDSDWEQIVSAAATLAEATS